MPITKQELLDFIAEDSVEPVKPKDVSDTGVIYCSIDDPFGEIPITYTEAYRAIVGNRIVRALTAKGYLVKPKKV